MRTFREILNESLTSAKKKFFEEFPKNEKTEAMFNELVSYDPTPQNKYLDWIVKEYIDTSPDDKISYDLLPKLIKWFHNNSQKLGEIRKYSWDQILEMWKESEETKGNGKLGINKLVEGTDYEKVFDNGKVIVFEVFTYKASRAIGGNSIGEKFESSNPPHAMVSQEWCIVSNENHWLDYSAKGSLYFIMDLKNNIKYALHFRWNLYGLSTEDLKNNPMEYVDLYDVKDHKIVKEFLHVVLDSLSVMNLLLNEIIPEKLGKHHDDF